MLIKQKSDIAPSEITSENTYLNRRKFLKMSGIAASAMPLMACADLEAEADAAKQAIQQDQPTLDSAQSASQLDYLAATPDSESKGFYTAEKRTPEQAVKEYCNFYEFGTDKGDPARYAHEMTTEPWSVQVDGEANKTGKYHLEDLINPHQLEERIYRFRCVEAWSMVVPWVGIPLRDVLKRFEPNSNARYVSFETLYRPEEMRGTRSAFSTIDWPYREGLRIDEAMHPLTLLVVGLYGKVLPNQNGAPLRLMVPWKYGFKSIKSIARISFTEQQPDTSWNRLSPREYGFFSNVNPDVDHPRWSQARERRLPSTLLNPNRIQTQLFNGYQEQVASLYSDMNLRKYF